jgi:hypothetical protein
MRHKDAASLQNLFFEACSNGCGAFGDCAGGNSLCSPPLIFVFFGVPEPTSEGVNAMSQKRYKMRGQECPLHALMCKAFH